MIHHNSVVHHRKFITIARTLQTTQSLLSHLRPLQLLQRRRQFRPKIAINNRIDKLMHPNNLLTSLVKVQRPHVLINILARESVGASFQPHDDAVGFAVFDDVVYSEVEV
jgi:hypothetical protein